MHQLATVIMVLVARQSMGNVCASPVSAATNARNDAKMAITAIVSRNVAVYMANVIQKRDNVIVKMAGKDITVIDHARRAHSAKIVKSSAIV